MVTVTYIKVTKVTYIEYQYCRYMVTYVEYQLGRYKVTNIDFNMLSTYMR